ncbi:MAG: hypothetical protein ACLU38_01340 [Dysosmobacter sp.]
MTSVIRGAGPMSFWLLHPRLWSVGTLAWHYPDSRAASSTPDSEYLRRMGAATSTRLRAGGGPCRPDQVYIGPLETPD